MSHSSRMVDWSDKLKHMEIKDVMDINLDHMAAELDNDSSSKDMEKSIKDKKNSWDDSFTHYLEQMRNDDDIQDEDYPEFNYNLDQLGSYQSCYIDNKTPIKNRGPVPEDIISHLDYLDEGVLI